MKNDCETFSESNFFLLTSACYNSFCSEEWMKWMCSETWKKLFSIYQFVIRTTLTLIWELSFETFFHGIKVLIGPFCTSQKKFHKEPSFVLYSANMLSFAKKSFSFQGHESSINMLYHVQMIKSYLLYQPKMYIIF